MRCGKSRAAQLAITVEVDRGNCGMSETFVGHIMLGVARSVQDNYSYTLFTEDEKKTLSSL